MQAHADIIGGLLDIATAAICLIISIGCIILAKVILREHNTPRLEWQRAALYFVAGASFANGFTYWPEDWIGNFGGHRPTGIVLVISIAILIWVMVWRGNIVNGGRMYRAAADLMGPRSRSGG